MIKQIMMNIHQKNFLKEVKKISTSVLEKKLLKYDRDTFAERIDRIKWLKRIIPKAGYLLEFESAMVFDEAKNTFINGEFVATIVLAIAFIEHWLQAQLSKKGFIKESKKGLKFIINFMRQKGLLHDYLVKKIDDLRLLRNPFVHLKSIDYPHKIMNKAISERKMPWEVLENDAKNALSLMYKVSITNY